MRDTEVEQLNLETFLQELEGGERAPLRERIFQCGLAFAASFPTVVPCTNLIIACSERYNPETQEIRADGGRVVAWINVESV